MGLCVGVLWSLQMAPSRVTLLDVCFLAWFSTQFWRSACELTLRRLEAIDAYCDDIHLLGPPDVVATALQWLRERIPARL